MFVILNVPLVGLWVKVLTVPLHYLIPAILMFGVIGSFSARNSVFDLYLVTAAGILGYLLRKLGFQLAPLVLALILGPFIEKYLRQSLFLSRGELDILWDSALSRTVWAIAALALVLGVVRAALGRVRSKGSARLEDVGEPV